MQGPQARRFPGNREIDVSKLDSGELPQELEDVVFGRVCRRSNGPDKQLCGADRGYDRGISPSLHVLLDEDADDGRRGLGLAEVRDEGGRVEQQRSARRDRRRERVPVQRGAAGPTSGIAPSAWPTLCVRILAMERRHSGHFCQRSFRSRA